MAIKCKMKDPNILNVGGIFCSVKSMITYVFLFWQSYLFVQKTTKCSVAVTSVKVTTFGSNICSFTFMIT